MISLPKPCLDLIHSLLVFKTACLSLLADLPNFGFGNTASPGMANPCQLDWRLLQVGDVSDESLFNLTFIGHVEPKVMKALQFQVQQAIDNGGIKLEVICQLLEDLPGG